MRRDLNSNAAASQPSTDEIEAARAHALAAGRHYWNAATHRGIDIQAPTERDLEHLGRRVLAQASVADRRQDAPIAGKAVGGRSYTFEPRGHGGVPGPYAGFNVPIGGGLIIGGAIGPSDDDAFDIYGQVGFGGGGAFGGYTRDPRETLEGVSGSITGGGRLDRERGLGVNAIVGDGGVSGAGIAQKGLPSVTYGVNLDEGIGEFGRFVRELGGFVGREINRISDPGLYYRPRDEYR